MMGMELRLEFPALPPSVNTMYISSPKLGMRFKSKEAKDWDNMVREYIPMGTMFPVGVLSVEVEFHAPWFTLKNKVRKADLDSRFKALFDSVFKCFDVDDSYIFEIVAKKVISKEKKTIIIINALDEN